MFLNGSGMNAEQYLNLALGGNMNIGTLKPLAWHEIMEGYARHKQNIAVVPCPKHSQNMHCHGNPWKDRCGNEPCKVATESALAALKGE
jgi:hypothetical protein